MPAKRKTAARRKAAGRATRRGSNMPNLNITSPSQFKQLSSVIGKHPVVLVLVYADWCGHCQRFKPDWKNLSKTPARNMPMVAVRDDALKNSPLNNLVNPEGYPTVAVVNKASNVSVNLPTRDPEVLKNVVTNANTLSNNNGNNNNSKTFNMNINNLLNNTDESNTLESTNLVNEYPLNTKKVAATRVTKPITRDTIEPPMSEDAYLPSNASDEENELLSQTLTGTKSTMNQLGGGLYEKLLRLRRKN